MNLVQIPENSAAGGQMIFPRTWVHCTRTGYAGSP